MRVQPTTTPTRIEARIERAPDPAPIIPLPGPDDNGNPGIVPPWLQQAHDEYRAWQDDGGQDNPYREDVGNSPYDYGLTPEDVAAMYAPDDPERSGPHW